MRVFQLILLLKLLKISQKYSTNPDFMLIVLKNIQENYIIKLARIVYCAVEKEFAMPRG